MNFKNSLLLAAALAAVTAASAATANDSAAFQAPAPTKVVTPTELPRDYRNSVVTLRLKVDAAGKPSDVRIKGRHDARLVRRLTEAVSQWEFTPARRNGVPVGAQVELPLKLTEA
jgi:TonB family protein